MKRPNENLIAIAGKHMQARLMYLSPDEDKAQAVTNLDEAKILQQKNYIPVVVLTPKELTAIIEDCFQTYFEGNKISTEQAN